MISLQQLLWEPHERYHNIIMKHNNERINGDKDVITDHGEGFSLSTSEIVRISSSDRALDSRYVATGFVSLFRITTLQTTLSKVSF